MACGVAGWQCALAGGTLASLQGRIWQTIATDRVNIDISERKRVEEELRQSHDELQAIYDQAEDGIVIVPIEKP